MKHLSWVVTLLVLAGCNPVKQVQRDPEKTKKVVDYFMLHYAQDVDDTVYVRVAGDTVVNEVVTVERVPDIRYLEAKNDTIYVIKTRDRLRVDTLKVFIPDNKTAPALRRIVAERDGTITTLQSQLKEKDKDVSEIRKEYNAFKRWVYVSLILLVVGFVLGFILKVKSPLKWLLQRNA